jgi:hypothetical protein
MKKVEISNKFYLVVVYIFLIYSLLINLITFSFDFFTIVKLFLIVLTTLLVFIKHIKLKLGLQIITVMNIIGSILVIISLFIKFGIDNKLSRSLIDIIYIIFDLIVSFYVFFGTKRFLSHKKNTAPPKKNDNH